MKVRERVIGELEKLFGGRPAFLARAPGRVNLIGEHTDYNDGFVLPMAMELAVWIALRPRDDRRVRVRSLDFGGTAEIDLENLRGGDPREAGRLMAMSHASLRDDFKVSSPGLDAIVEITRRLDGCYGARMTGAGFGGSAVARMREGTAGSRGPGIVDEYRRATGRDATLYSSLPAGGASVEAAGEAGRG
jgi:galactokinase